MREANLTTFTCRMSRKSGSLNLLEPSGPHRACYGPALPFFRMQTTAASQTAVSATKDKIINKCTMPVINLHFMHLNNILIVDTVFNATTHIFEQVPVAARSKA